MVGQNAPQIAGTLFQAGAMLALVLGLFFGGVAVFRRASGRSGAQSPEKELRVRASLALDSKKRILLVQVMGETLLLGVTPEGISNLGHVGKYGSNGAPEIAAGALKPFSDREGNEPDAAL